MSMQRRQAIQELLDAKEELFDAWEELTTAAVRRCEGWDDPDDRVREAHHRVRTATSTASRALDQALAVEGLSAGGLDVVRDAFGLLVCGLDRIDRSDPVYQALADALRPLNGALAESVA